MVVCWAVVHVQQVGASGAQAVGCTLCGVPADSSGALPFAGVCTSGTAAGHAMGIVAVAVCVLCGHQRDVPAHSMLQLCAEVSCRSCMRQQSAGHILTDQPAAPVVAPCVCLRACVSRCRGAVGASHPLSEGRNHLQRRSSPPPPPFGKSGLLRGRSQPQLQIPLECTL